MKTSDLAKTSSEKLDAARSLIQTEKTDAVNTGIVGSADRSGQMAAGSSSVRRSVSAALQDTELQGADTAVSGTVRTVKGVRRTAARLAGGGSAGDLLKEKFSKRSIAARARSSAKSGVHGALQGSEVDGLDDEIEAVSVTGKSLKKAYRRVNPAKGSLALEEATKRKAKRSSSKQKMREMQSRRNQMRAQRAAAQQRAASSAQTGIAGRGAGASSSAAAGSASSGGSGCLGCAAALPVMLIALLLAGILMITLIAGAADEESNAGSLSGTEAAVASYFLGKGLEDVQVAAIMGNIYQESGFDPALKQALEGGGTGPGRGLLQWEVGSDRFNGLVALAQERGTTWDDINVQLDYIWQECPEMFDTYSSMYHVYSPGAIAGLGRYMAFGEWCGIGDVDWATESFERVFTRASKPNMDRRIQKAREYLDALRSSGGSASYVNNAIAIANDDAHGYSQSNRDLNPDVDCSSLVYYSLQQAGYDVGGSAFTTYSMGSILVGAGFVEHPFSSVDELQPGDILLRSGHTEIYIGDGRNVGAHRDYDGRPGDSSGDEVDIGECGTSWTYFYRYIGE